MNHPKRGKIAEEVAKSIAGYNGEKSIDFHLSFLDKQKYIILHDIRISDNEGRYFQIDTLLLSTNFILIIEVKNISGTLFFDENFHQLIRLINDKEEAFPDPLLQVRRQKQQLQGWWNKQKYPELPIESMIVISNPSTIIKAAPYMKVVHAASLPYKITNLNRVHKQELLNVKVLKKITNTLLKQHVPLEHDFLKQYGILKTELLKGVHCQECNEITMTRKRGYWYCSKCQHRSSYAHKLALNDYALLIETKITNQKFRDFIGISSSTIATKLLSELNLKHSGETKGRKYKLDLPLE
ncbi:nuclease-related domain-containing protein [Alkalihalobacillus sp. BA299]|uniref:nuclease-related domain-containing protein n=1 Tax=Alkalihalobacillus sp. BA299 TaxID=2815938 RepID=UPI001AD9E8E6|nr:nuclease-related domain-containing protein [Alkalihalobacillus sp. BA299]